MNDDSTESKHRQVTIHERLGDLCIAFHQLQDELLSQADAEKGARLQQLATLLIVLSREHSDQGPQDENIASSRVRMLANRNGIQLLRPGDYYRLNKTPTRHRGLADHHHFAWTNFSPHMMWEQ